MILSTFTKFRRVMSKYPSIRGLQRFLLGTRLVSIPLQFLDENIPEDCTVFELGCGQGVLANYLLLDSPSRRLVGMDVSVSRVRVAASSVQNCEEVLFLVGDITQLPLRLHVNDSDSTRHFIISQVLYLLPVEEAERILESICERMSPGDVFWLVDYCRSSTVRYWFLMIENLLLTLAVTTAMRLSGPRGRLYLIASRLFGSRERRARIPDVRTWLDMLARCGLVARQQHPREFNMFPQVVFRCEKA